MSNRRQFIKTTLSPAAMSALAPFSAFAQKGALPLEQVKIVTGFPAGGSADVTSRRIGDKLGNGIYSKSPGVVENKTGAAGRIAAETVKAAPADGSTLLLTPYSIMSIYPHIYSKLGYDAFKDFVPVAIGSVLTHGLAVGPMVPSSVKNIKDFLAWAKANPDNASYGSPAAGSTPHFLGVLLSLNSGVELKHIPYRGSVPGITDVIGGQLAAMVTPHGDFLANHKAEKLRVIATSGAKRSPFLPDVPTFVEQGFPDLVIEEWFGFYAPAKTPSNVVVAANAAINAALKDKVVIDSLALSGLIPMAVTPEEVARETKRQYEVWGPIVKRIGFTAES